MNIPPPSSLILPLDLAERLTRLAHEPRHLTPDDAIFVLSRPDDFTLADADWVRSRAVACLEFAAQREAALHFAD